MLNLRNSFNVKPVSIVLPKGNESFSLSDAFCWRVSKNFETSFRFTDLIKYFTDFDEAPIKLVLKNHNNNIINTVNVHKKDFNSKITIRNYIQNTNEKSGHFFIFHKLNSIKNDQILLRNSCYTGYSYKQNIDSIVHGNLPVVAINKFCNPYKENIIQRSYLKNYTYKVQNNFIAYDKVEAFFFNPLSCCIKVSINNMILCLNPHNSKILKLPKSDIYTIKSKCLLMRPIFFVYKGKNFDTFHG